METEFTLENIPGLTDLWNDAVQDVIDDINKKGGTGARKVTLTTTFDVFAGDVIVATPKIKASFPQGEPQESLGVKCQVKDGRLWIVPGKQEEMFKE